ncbi:MAG: YHS domain-containing protein [Candidatus Brocadiaceae bacterium]|nr:YHS domain-containing protein [Candidatus Brocadiaceae bacterium]
MNCILRTALVFTFVVGLSSTYVSKALWACGGACGSGDLSSHESGGHSIQTKAEGKGEKAEAVKDPVCSMDVSDIKKAPSEEYKGKVYYFCSEHCKKTFKKDPASYISSDISSEVPQPGKGEGHKH